MEIKLKELREQRLNDREENVEKLQEKRLYEALDELRKNYSEVFAFAFKQNEKAIKYNQDIDKLEKEKLKEQCKRDELKEKKVLEFEQNKKYLEYVMNQKKEDDRIENIKKNKKNFRTVKGLLQCKPQIIITLWKSLTPRHLNPYPKARLTKWCSTLVKYHPQNPMYLPIESVNVKINALKMVTRSLSIHECLREVLKSLMNNNLDGDNLSEKNYQFFQLYYICNRTYPVPFRTCCENRRHYR